MTKSDAEEAPPKKGVLPFILIVLFLDAMGAGLILPVVPGLIKELTNMENAGAAAVAGYLLFTFAGVQFVFAPVLGALSDRYGRRPVLLLALFGFSIDYFLAAFAPTLIWLFVARAFSGLFGATFPAANAAIVDTTS
ncbi:MAG: MFS transporter, partial [Pseudomonadota bacterium]